MFTQVATDLQHLTLTTHQSRRAVPQTASSIYELCQSIVECATVTSLWVDGVDADPAVVVDTSLWRGLDVVDGLGLEAHARGSGGAKVKSVVRDRVGASYFSFKGP